MISKIIEERVKGRFEIMTDSKQTNSNKQRKTHSTITKHRK